MAFVVGKDPQDENRRVLASTKNNLALPPASLMFGLEEAESGSVRVAWHGPCEVSAKDLLATPQDQEHSDARSEAIEFLKEVLGDGPVAASQLKEEAEDAGISGRTLARAKKVLGVMSYREGETGERGKGHWLWKLPVVELVDEIKDAKGCQEQNSGILNHSEGNDEAKFRIGKPNTLRLPTDEMTPVKDADSIKDARLPTLENGGTLDRSEAAPIKDAKVGILKECGHGYPGGKACYLCDPDHPYR
jgi:hypothetical protein